MGYIEIDKTGGDLSEAINTEFKKIGSNLRAKKMDLPLTNTRIEANNKFSQIYGVANATLYTSDYWRNGAILAKGNTDNLSLIAQSVDYWICNDITTKELAAKFPFIYPNKQSEAFDTGNEVLYAWNRLYEWNDKLRKVIEIILKDDTLSKLFPYTSIGRLCFSRCTGYPYTYDIPDITPVYNEIDKYIVHDPDGNILGEGNAQQVVSIVKAAFIENEKYLNR